MRLVLYGGSFSPIHYGHAAVMKWAADTLPCEADELWVAPAVTHAFSKRLVDFDVRAAWVRAIEPRAQVLWSDHKFTADTVAELYRDMPNLERVVLLLGADILGDLDRWEKWDELKDMVDVAIITRPGYQVEGCEFPVFRVDTPDVSSTQLRARLAAGGSLDGLCPPVVADWYKNK